MIVIGEPCNWSSNLDPSSIQVLKSQYTDFCLPVLLRPWKTGESWNLERHALSSNKRTTEISKHPSMLDNYMEETFS